MFQQATASDLVITTDDFFNIAEISCFHSSPVPVDKAEPEIQEVILYFELENPWARFSVYWFYPVNQVILLSKFFDQQISRGHNTIFWWLMVDGWWLMADGWWGNVGLRCANRNGWFGLLSFSHRGTESTEKNSLIIFLRTAFMAWCFSLDGRWTAWLCRLSCLVGIFFYTFQAMSYAIDIYRKEIEPIYTRELAFRDCGNWFVPHWCGNIRLC